MSHSRNISTAPAVCTIPALTVVCYPATRSWYGIMGMGAIVHTLNPRLSDKVCVCGCRLLFRSHVACLHLCMLCAPATVHASS